MLNKKVERCLRLPLVFGRFRRGTDVKPEVDAWIAAQRLNRLAQAAVAEAMAPLMLW